MQRVTRSMRSGIRRYPGAIMASLFSRNDLEAVAVAEFLHHLAPHKLAAAWLGHAGVVCRFDDLTLAVDPVLSSRIGPRIGRRTIGPARLAPAPVAPGALRGLGLVLITHAHFDHLDRPTLEAMAHPATTVAVPRGCARLVPPGFGGVIELTPGQTFTQSGVEVTAISPRHWGARMVWDRHRGAISYRVRSAAGAALFGGDTAHTDAFDSLREIDIAVLGIGAYNPWEHMHTTPEQAWDMFTRMGARFLLPVHRATFELSDEPPDEPLRRLLAVAGEARDRVLVCEPGEVLVVEQPRTSRPSS